MYQSAGNGRKSSRALFKGQPRAESAIPATPTDPIPATPTDPTANYAFTARWRRRYEVLGYGAEAAAAKTTHKTAHTAAAARQRERNVVRGAGGRDQPIQHRHRWLKHRILTTALPPFPTAPASTT